MGLKRLAKAALPPAAYERLRKLLRRNAGIGDWVRGEQGVEYYDRSFNADPTWRLHYTRSPYYPLWTVVVDRLRRRHARKVLEIGCGSGQLARSIRDSGIVEKYLGFDFSPNRVGQARLACPEYRFEVADALKTDLIRIADYDTVVSTEFFEHVHADLDIISQIRPGAAMIASVPNFPYVSHVRHFGEPSDVVARYGALFDSFSVTPLPKDDRGNLFFVMEGVRAAGR
jgi:2-polyprenyl-3-methyl-5-hydroxy-6-metoxy-1,4-benzoquinol methylase